MSTAIIIRTTEFCTNGVEGRAIFADSDFLGSQGATNFRLDAVR
jgi:hypothetical protein